MSFQAAVAYFAFGWAAGLGTVVLAARSARGARRAQLLRDLPGWRSYAPVSRPRHANSDNGAPMTARPPIEPQGQAPVRPQPHGDRMTWADGTPVGAPVGPVTPPPLIDPRFAAYWASRDADSRAIANAAARRSGIWQPQANNAVQQLADEGDRAPAEAVINDASRLWMRHDMGRATSPPVQVREPYSPSHVAECGGPCETIGICDCGNPPNLPPGPLHPVPPANP